jgi:hypothetical protein
VACRPPPPALDRLAVNHDEHHPRGGAPCKHIGERQRMLTDSTLRPTRAPSVRQASAPSHSAFRLERLIAPRA